jgi:DNA replication protein DnaC
MEHIGQAIMAATDSLQSGQNTLISANQPQMTERRPLTESEVLAVLEGIGIPKRYLHAKRADISGDYWKLTEGYRTGQHEGLYIHGIPGCGKSHLAAALIRARIESIKVNAEIEDASLLSPGMLWVSVIDLLLEIKRSFKDDSDATEDEVIGKYSRVKYLTLDDIGVEKTTDWVLQTLYTIIDKRYRDMKRTVITSNLTLDQIADKIGDRIASRIAGMCDVIELKGKDRRTGA